MHSIRSRNRSLNARSATFRWILCSLLLLLGALPSLADGGVVFQDVSLGDRAGVTFRRTPSPDRLAVREQIFASLPIPITEFLSVTRPSYAMKPRGVPGVALLDFDVDGDLDVYVTNGPGSPNSLYSSQLKETGALSFVDVGLAAGVDATDQDSTGVCFGDIDNDGDPDLYVVGTGSLFHLFENNGDGTFTDISIASGTAGDGRHANGCSFGDVNGDGLLDLVVANTYDDWTHRVSTIAGPNYPRLEHNQLFVNQGANKFADVSAASGIENVSNMSGPGLTGAAFTWAIAMVDLDQDGDTDILSADNQGGAPTNTAERRGWNRFFANDGSGHFTDITRSVGLDAVEGGWMAIAVADFNCDGNLDFFTPNVGDYGGPFNHSYLFSGNSDGTFTPSGPPELNVFGWGSSTLDYDNDGDSDLVYYGGFDILNLIFADNPGVVFQNQGGCSGELLWDQDAVAFDHRFRNVQGLAVGDINDDGFTDIVSASNFDIVPDGNAFPFWLLTIGFPPGGPFDSVAVFENVLTGRIVPGHVAEANPNLQLPDGTLSVELNSAGNGNHWIKVRTRGSAGSIPGGTVNRDGIGAVVRFTPDGGPTSVHPILGGSSYASQDSLELGFGLGAADEGTLEVLWPGGTRNRLMEVEAGESILFPEIPCSFDAEWPSFQAYHDCVQGSLDALVAAGALAQDMKGRFLSSAIVAFQQAH